MSWKIFYAYSLLGSMLLLATTSFGLVSGPESSVVQGEWVLDIRSSEEKGKQKPFEDPNSWSNTKIRQDSLGVGYGLGDFAPGLEDVVIKVEARLFQSTEERLNNKTYYEKDNGSLALGLFSAKLLKTSDASLTGYFGATLYKKANLKKFGNPRIDRFQGGLMLSTIFAKYGLFDQLIHYGSGDTGQNKYVLSTTTLGIRLGSPTFIEPSFKAGPYIEVDTSDREDSGYGYDFSTSSAQDRIRQWKYAMATTIDVTYKRRATLGYTKLKKLAGQDLRSTEASLLYLSVKI